MPGVKELVLRNQLFISRFALPFVMLCMSSLAASHAQFRLTREMQHHPGVSPSE